MKKGYHKICLSLIVCCSLLAPTSISIRANTQPEESKEYIIKVDDPITLESFKKEYGEQIVEEKTTDILEENNIVVVEMTASEVQEQIKNKDVIVEEDIILEAMTDQGVLSELSILNEVDTQEQLVTWNLKAVNGDQESLKDIESSNISCSAIKIGVIDSGIEYLSEIEPKERVNLTKSSDAEIEYDNPIYEDITGHGTGVAGIISAKDDNAGLVGISPNAQLYDIKVFDENNCAPLSRIIEGIQYAIDQKVNVLNMSFGTSIRSEIFHQKIIEAYDSGILLVAASGNKGKVEYPAAFNEVIAVGATTSQNTVADFSRTGTVSDIVAPGAAVLTTGLLGGYGVENGTSIAAPHVTGAAALLWSKDLSKSNDFIRQLLIQSARKLDDINTGSGLLDIKRAFEIYEEFSKSYEPQKIEYEYIADNERELESFLENYVVGSWGTQAHETILQNTEGLTTQAMSIVKLGMLAPDSSKYGLQGMGKYPQWHGFTSWGEGANKKYCNYMASYIYLTEIALGFPKEAKNTGVFNSPLRPTYLSLDDYSQINGKVTATKFGDVTWEVALGRNPVTDRNKRLFMYGCALHTVTDLFAHSTYRLNGTYIDHPQADDIGILPNRYTCAKNMVDAGISHIKGYTKGSISDFVYALKDYDGSFKMPSYSKKALLTDKNYYEANKVTFDKISQ